jgi:hypothetical protein
MIRRFGINAQCDYAIDARYRNFYSTCAEISKNQVFYTNKLSRSYGQFRDGPEVGNCPRGGIDLVLPLNLH